jgi:hypothetical protein
MSSRDQAIADAELIHSYGEFLSYLHEHAKNGTTPPEGSITAAVRARLASHPHEVKMFAETLTNWELAKEGFRMPFQEAHTVEEVAAATGLRPDTLETLGKRAMDEHITEKLIDRMGTDADLPPTEPTRRDEVAAAFAVHTESPEGV